MRLVRVDIPDGTVALRVHDCPVCTGEHFEPLLRNEAPVRIQHQHSTYPYRFHCPAKQRDVLINLLGDGSFEATVVAPLPSDLTVPPIYTSEDAAEPAAE